MGTRATVLGGLALAALMASSPAEARNLYFDMWCQEQGYVKERCDARSPTDVDSFEAYWRAVEKYEEPYYYNRQEDARFRDELNSRDTAQRPGIASYEPETAAHPD